MKKEVNVKQILDNPKQSLLERLYGRLLKNTFIAAAFSTMILWLNKAFAEEYAFMGQIAYNKVAEAFQYFRKMIFIVGLFILIVLSIFSIFKKAARRYLAYSLYGVLIVTIFSSIVDTRENYPGGNYWASDLIIPFGVLFFLFIIPLLVLVVLYKAKKIKKETLKKHLIAYLVSSTVFVLPFIIQLHNR